MPKADKKKKSKEDEQTLEELIKNSAHRRSQAKCQLTETSYIERIKLFLFLPYNKHLINLTAFGLYLRPRSRFSRTDLLLG